MKLTKRQTEILEIISQPGGRIIFIYRLKGLYAFGDGEMARIKQKTLGALVDGDYVEQQPNMMVVISKKGQKYLESLK